MLIRKATKDDAGNFNKLTKYCFADPYLETQLFKEIFDWENTVIVEDEGKMAGGYTLYPFQMTYGDTNVKMGGVSCVVMDVNARYKGYAKAMLTHMISDMHQRDFVFSALGAFNLGFYRKLGWEVVFDNMVFEADIDLFKPYLTHEYDIEKFYGAPKEKLSSVQKEFAKKYNGYIPREDSYWDVYEKLITKDKYLTSVVSKNGLTKGYMVYRFQDSKLKVSEIVYADINGLKALLGVIYMHNAQYKKLSMITPTDFPLRLLVDDQYKVDAKLETLMMNRVVDVKKAFELGCYPDIGEHHVALMIEDQTAEWNDGVWHLYMSLGNIKAEKGERGEKFDAKISVQKLSQMLMGYESGKTLLELGLVESYTDEAKAFIEGAFLKKQTYMNNRF